MSANGGLEIRTAARLLSPLRPPCERNGRDQRQDGRSPPGGRDDRRGEARGRLPPDGVAGDQRQPAGPGRDARARPRRDAGARLPAELSGARARHRAVADARRGELRHHALRAGVDALLDRARRARRRLLHHHRQPRGARPRLRAQRRRAAPHAGRRRHPRHRPARGLGRGARRPAARHPARGGRGRPRARAAGRRRRPVRRRGPRHAAPAGARPPDRRPHRGPRRLPRGRPAHRRLALHAGGRRRRRAADARRRLEPALRLRAGETAGGEGERDLRRERPDGAGRAARAARGGPRDPAPGQRGRVRRHPRGSVLHAAAHDGAPGLRGDRAPQPAPHARDDRVRAAIRRRRPSWWRPS